MKRREYGSGRTSQTLRRRTERQLCREPGGGGDVRGGRGFQDVACYKYGGGSRICGRRSYCLPQELGLLVLHHCLARSLRFGFRRSLGDKDVPGARYATPTSVIEKP